MSSHFPRLFLLPLLAGVLLLAATSIAQNQGNQKQLPKIKLTGTIVGFNAPYIQMKVETFRVNFAKDDPQAKDWDPQKYPKDEEHAIAIDPAKTKLQIFGKAGVDYLRPGQQVKFSGRYDLNNRFVGKVELIDVMIPDKRFVPEAKFDVPRVSFVKEEKPKFKDFDAKGVVVAARNGSLTVRVQNNQSITVPVSPEAEVRFTTDKVGVAKPGDPITVTGRMFKPAKVIGEGVTITLKAPEEGAEGEAKKEDPEK